MSEKDTPLNSMDVAQLNIELDKARQGLEAVNKDMAEQYMPLNEAVKAKLIAEEKIHVIRNKIKSYRTIADELKQKINIIKYFIKAEAHGE